MTKILTVSHHLQHLLVTMTWLCVGCAPGGMGFHSLGGASDGGRITPTIYNTPRFTTGKNSCAYQEVEVTSAEGTPLARLCKSEVRNCAEQGLCQVVDGDKITNLGLNPKSSPSAPQFNKVDFGSCKFGFGSRENICLDPYHSIAADLSIYPLGDVIFIPEVRGTMLNDGTTHDGYFVVRDSGGSIKGAGRFDFFIGFDKIDSPENAFTRLQLADTETHFSFYLITGAKADSVRKARAYPGLAD